ncbi:putative ATP-dependent RNA helicase DDX23 [Thelohanellus kitauei]|uniref:Putative ATP-dependent RNA helicase DDX23 n=1 Tax=Thelohanellus kitauei TaxID=669202 RepID=A0A0C2MFV4_THEKT|nr:putative ATP-dependent RNA helicase DDX23 [Thelohanellus kitauei]
MSRYQDISDSESSEEQIEKADKSLPKLVLLIKPSSVKESSVKNLNIDANVDKVKKYSKFCQPVFLTKQQREQLALERREQEIKQRKREIEEMKKKHKEFLDPRRKERREKSRDSRKSSEQLSESVNTIFTLQKSLDAKSLQAIRDRYIGAGKRKRRTRRYTERKFLFDWETSEDTSRDYNELFCMLLI